MRRIGHAFIAAALCLGFAGAPAPAAPTSQASAPVRIDKARLDRTLQEMVATARIAGGSALIWQSGSERYFGSSGFADRESGWPMSRNTLVQIWSMTKPITGVALMQLWEKGAFRLDDPLGAYLPEFAIMRVYAGPGPDKQPQYRPAARPITIRDIMRHTAGLAYGMRGGEVDDQYRRADPLNPNNDLSEMARRLAGLPLFFDPGTEWSYSSGVDVQARLVELLSGQPFETYVREHIFNPLKMRDAGWTQPAANRSRLAATYRQSMPGRLDRLPDEQNRANNFVPRKLIMGGAGVVASIDDYMRFARMLLNEGELDGVRILRPSTVRLMATNQLDPSVKARHFLPTKGNVGFGLDFAVRVGQPKNAAENRGATGEFFWDGLASTFFWVDPANDLAAVFFVQKLPTDIGLQKDFRAAVYGADYLGPPGD